MTPLRSRAPGKRHSFTLIELLVVIAIGAILAVISAGAYSKIVRSTTVSTSSQMLTGALDFARQTAITRNADVEFRIYELPDPNSASPTPTEFRGFQTFLIVDATTNALTKATYLPNPAVIAPQTTVSSIIGINQPLLTAASFGSLPIPVYGTTYNAVAFRFSPTGGLETPSTTAGVNAVANGWFMSLVLLNDKNNTTGNTSLPANFATIQLDPFSGRAKVFRP
jgi:uncharacterized protein (TIGR02596 family)